MNFSQSHEELSCRAKATIPIEIDDIFADIIDRTKTLDPANARKWFDKLTVLHMDGGSLGIGCPDGATLEMESFQG